MDFIFLLIAGCLIFCGVIIGLTAGYALGRRSVWTEVAENMRLPIDDSILEAEELL